VLVSDLTALRSGIAGFLPDDVSAATVLSVTLKMSSTVCMQQINHRMTSNPVYQLREYQHICQCNDPSPNALITSHPYVKLPLVRSHMN